MATLYDNTNTFTLFKNDKGDNPKRPDYTGKMNVDGIGFKISGWINEGANGKFIAGQVQLVKEMPGENKQVEGADVVDGDIPF